VAAIVLYDRETNSVGIEHAMRRRTLAHPLPE